MNSKDEIRAFLVSRRANVTPEQAGIRHAVGERRVPGLRRAEVAELAGVSQEYYTRLERGNIRGASESVLGAIATALQLNDAEREYLFDLARAVPSGASPTRRATPTVRTSVQRVLDGMATPAIVYDATQDLVAANLLGRALYAPLFDTDGVPNMARFVFLDSRAPDFYVDWALARTNTAAMLRLEAGRDPLNRDLTALIGELSTRSPQFRHDWADRDVHQHTTGAKAFRHPEVGIVDVAYDVFELPGQRGLQMVTFSAPPGTDAAEKFALLASWAATREQEHSPDRSAAPAPAPERNA